MIRFQLAIFDEDAAPDDLAGLADAFQRSAAKAEIHRRLPLARPCRDIHPMKCAGGTAPEISNTQTNLTHSYVFAIAQIVQRRFRRERQAHSRRGWSPARPDPRIRRLH